MGAEFAETLPTLRMWAGLPETYSTIVNISCNDLHNQGRRDLVVVLAHSFLSEFADRTIPAGVTAREGLAHITADFDGANLIKLINCQTVKSQLTPITA